MYNTKHLANFIIVLIAIPSSTIRFGFVNLSILLGIVIFLCPACDRVKEVSQGVITPEETVEHLPSGEGLVRGTMAPEFSLPDAHGNTHSLSGYSGQKLVIVFDHSGESPFSQAHLRKLQKGYEDIKAQGAEMIVLSSDPLALVKWTQQAFQITFPLLSDENMETIAAYNVVESDDPDFARPATYIIDEDGRVAWKSLGSRFGYRASPDLIVIELRKLSKQFQM